MIDSHFVILGAILQLFGSASYVVATLKGKTKPNRVTWFLWALAPLVAFSAELSKGVGLESLMTFMVGFGPALVFIASFVNKKAYWKITRLDYFCGAISVLGLILWLILREGDIAISAAIVADAAASLPTIRKSFTNPETESPWVFLGASISAVITLLAIEHFTLASAGFPVYILLCCLILFVLIRFQAGRWITAKLQANKNSAA
jgi:hypothetical protein